MRQKSTQIEIDVKETSDGQGCCNLNDYFDLMQRLNTSLFDQGLSLIPVKQSFYLRYIDKGIFNVVGNS